MEQKVSKTSDEYFNKLSNNLVKCVLQFLDYPQTIALGAVNKKFYKIVFSFGHNDKFTLESLNKNLKNIDLDENLWKNNYYHDLFELTLKKFHGFYTEILKQEKNFSQETFQNRFAYFIAKNIFNNDNSGIYVELDHKPDNFEFVKWMINMTARMKNFSLLGKFTTLTISGPYFYQPKVELDYCWTDMLNNRNISNLDIGNIDLNDEKLVLLQKYIKSNPLLEALELNNNQIGKSEGSKLFLESFVKNKSLTKLVITENLYDRNCLSIIDKIRISKDNSLKYLSFILNEFTKQDMYVLMDNFIGHELELNIYFSCIDYTFKKGKIDIIDREAESYFG